MLKPHLLIIGTSKDIHIDSVVSNLSHEIVYCRFNIDQYPSMIDMNFSFSSASLTNILVKQAEDIYDLSSVKAVWFRRIGAPILDPQIQDKAHRSFALGEIEAAIHGLVYLLSEATWISKYESTRRAASKLYQLKLAVECGLSIPATTVTNNYSYAQQFINSHQHTLYKTLHSPSVIYEHGRSLIFSRLLNEDDLEYLHQVKYAPCQFQPYIDKAYELRITFTGDTFHTVILHSQETPAGKIDWRAAGRKEISYELSNLPTAIEDKLRMLMYRLDLHYGAIDMIVTPNNEYIFLEVNPHGAYGWLERSLNLSISKKFADYISKVTLNL